MRNRLYTDAQPPSRCTGPPDLRLHAIDGNGPIPPQLGASDVSTSSPFIHPQLQGRTQPLKGFPSETRQS
jgi:hypothetical protein